MPPGPHDQHGLPGLLRRGPDIGPLIEAIGVTAPPEVTVWDRLPLIRYELGDVVAVTREPCYSATRWYTLRTGCTWGSSCARTQRRTHSPRSRPESGTRCALQAPSHHR